MTQTKIPQTVQQWNVTAQDGKAGFNALQFSEQPLAELGDNQVLVKSKFQEQQLNALSPANPFRQSRARPSTCVFSSVTLKFPLTNNVVVP
jgi:hypothetical protein